MRVHLCINDWVGGWCWGSRYHKQVACIVQSSTSRSGRGWLHPSICRAIILVRSAGRRVKNNPQIHALRLLAKTPSRRKEKSGRQEEEERGVDIKLQANRKRQSSFCAKSGESKLLTVAHTLQQDLNGRTRMNPHASPPPKKNKENQG